MNKSFLSREADIGAGETKLNCWDLTGGIKLVGFWWDLNPRSFGRSTGAFPLDYRDMKHQSKRIKSHNSTNQLAFNHQSIDLSSNQSINH